MRSLFFLPALTFVVCASLVSASSINAQETEQETAEPPELVALAWRPADDAKSLDEVFFWDANNEELDALIKRELVDAISIDDLRSPSPSDDQRQLHPLLMLFRQPPTDEEAAIAVPVINYRGDNPFSCVHCNPIGTSEFSTATLSPTAEELSEWPKALKVTVRYRSRKPLVIKEVTKDLSERHELVKDKAWSKVSMHGERLCLTFETATNLAHRFPSRYIEFRAYLNDGSQLADKNFLFWIRTEGIDTIVCRSIPISDPKELAKIEVIQTDFDFHEIGEIPLQTRIPNNK